MTRLEVNGTAMNTRVLTEVHALGDTAMIPMSAWFETF